MPYYAHTKEDEPEEHWQTIKEHSEQVAEKVCELSAGFCHPNYAWNLGLLHDICKYQANFQRRLQRKTIAVEHSVCGAKECNEYGLYLPGQYCIAGHHSGLPDLGTDTESPENSTLLARLNRPVQDYSAFRQELTPRTVAGPGYPARTLKEMAFWIRMMFSCLTDADYLDTERFCRGEVGRGVRADFA